MELVEGQVAVVTGAASGIGRALARRLLDEGMRVALADVERRALDVAVADLEARGEVIGVACDVSDEAAVEALAARVEDELGAVQLCCANAGVFSGGLIWETDRADWEWVVGVNTWGPLNCVRAFVPRMLASGRAGHVVITSSMAGLVGLALSSPYVVSKFGSFAIAESLAHDLALVGAPIGVSVVVPSLVATAIGTSGRNRPEHLSRPSTESARGVEEVLAAATATGLDPAAVADAIAVAVEHGTFLVPTKPSYASQIEERTKALLDGRLPDMPLID